MASIKNRIVDYVVGSNCLTFATGLPAGLSVRRGGLIASTTARQPEILVYVGPEIKWEPAGRRAGYSGSATAVLRAFRLICEIRENATLSEFADEQLDPLEVWVEKRLFADETCGGLAVGIVGWTVEQDARQSDQGYLVATVYADIEFVTVRGNPESQG